jgi:protein O-GlcNAc transferase
MSSDLLTAALKLGLALQKEGQVAAAEQTYRKVLEQAPRHPLAWHLLGIAVGQLGRWEEAIQCLQHSLQEHPADPVAWNNLATAWLDAGNSLLALEAADKSLSLAPGYQAALHSRAGATFGLGRYSEAAEAFGQVVDKDPAHVIAWAGLWRAAVAACDWPLSQKAACALQEAHGRGLVILPPFDALAFEDDPLMHRQCAEVFVAKQTRREELSIPSIRVRPAKSDGKIRLAYLSADFHEHATAYLMAEMFECHDRNRFDVTAVSFGPDDQSPMRQRLLCAFDHFWDVQHCTHSEVADRLRAANIDIAVDLKGFTRGCRTSILLRKPAPLLVNFLGYPGTMGTPIYDYLIGDAVVTPAEHARFYAEQLVQMPISYQVNDSHRVIGEVESTRQAQGLPPAGFVFAAFNAIYKITPEFFKSWMRLLHAVPGSVLWLISEDEVIRSRLCREAQECGVDPGRLVFAARVPVAQHLARHRFVDVLLDNLPVNAHTTTSDALWAGVPVVTCMGQAFAGRVAASLLHAVGLPELVTHSLPEYEALALRLATQPQELQRLRAHLRAVRSTAPLFDAKRFTRQLESAYVHMHERSLQGLPPEGFAVPETLGAGMQPLRSVPTSLQSVVPHSL